MLSGARGDAGGVLPASFVSFVSLVAVVSSCIVSCAAVSFEPTGVLLLLLPLWWWWWCSIVGVTATSVKKILVSCSWSKVVVDDVDGAVDKVVGGTFDFERAAKEEVAVVEGEEVLAWLWYWERARSMVDNLSSEMGCSTGRFADTGRAATTIGSGCRTCIEFIVVKA
mgnify:FL=1